MVLFCATIKRDSVSLSTFPFLRHVQISFAISQVCSFLNYFRVFLCTISPVCLLKYPYSCFIPVFFFLVFISFTFILFLLFHGFRLQYSQILIILLLYECSNHKVFLSQNPCIPSWSGVFQFGIFLNIASGQCSPWDFLQVLVILFSCNLSIRSFCYVLSAYISYSKTVLFSFSSNCWFILVYSPLTYW